MYPNWFHDSRYHSKCELLHFIVDNTQKTQSHMNAFKLKTVQYGSGNGPFKIQTFTHLSYNLFEKDFKLNKLVLIVLHQKKLM